MCFMFFDVSCFLFRSRGPLTGPNTFENRISSKTLNEKNRQISLFVPPRKIF